MFEGDGVAEGVGSGERGNANDFRGLQRGRTGYENGVVDGGAKATALGAEGLLGGREGEVI